MMAFEEQAVLHYPVEKEGDQVEAVVSSLVEVQKVVLAREGPSFQEEQAGWQFQVVAAYQLEAEVEGTEIFQGVIHQAEKLGPWQVRDLKAVVLKVVEVI